MMLDFTSPCGHFKITFEDDGKVAYAYLKEGLTGEIVGDVWLYNRYEAPDDQEWKNPANIPFANVRDYIDEGGRVQRKLKLKDVLVDWEYEDGIPVAYVYIEEDLYGVLGVGDKPGYARHAIKNGPLAKVMVISD